MRGALLLLCPAVLLAQGQPTFYAAYEDGLEHERAGRWREALAAYQRAIALRPKPAARVVIYGNNLLLDYYPYAHAARCQTELGQFEAARALLSRSENSGEPENTRSGLAARLPGIKAAAAPPVPPPVSIGPPIPATAPAEPSTKGVAEAPPPENRIQPSPEGPMVTRNRAEATPGSPAPSPPAREVEPKKTETPATTPSPSTPPEPTPAPPERPGWPVGLGLGAIGLLLLWALFRLRRPARMVAGYRDPVQVGPYRIGRLLGRGGFASTYLAWHPDTGTKVALKVLHPFREDDPEFVSRFRQEARLGTLLDHPNLVRMLDHGPEEGTPWLVMEFVSGERLDQRLRSAAPLPIPEVLRLGGEIAAAMSHAHALGVVHRDLKPSNVMLSESHAKVMDFGISRRMDTETLTTTYAFLGTPLYAAPEAQLKTQVGPASDRYALGIILFEMLVGHPPFRGETPFEILDQHRSQALPDLGALRSDLPASLCDLVERLCRKEPAERPEDAEVLRILGDLAQETETVPGIRSPEPG